MENAASSLHDGADAIRSGAKTVAKFTHKTADNLEKTADYVRAHDTGDMIDDAKAFIARNPRGAVAAAAAAGFLIGLMCRGRRE